MDLNQHNKTFLAGLDHLRKSNIYNAGTQSTNDKFVMIRFSYTSCDHLLPELKNKLCCYHLMHDISSLFLGIHGVPEYMPGQLTYGENINEKDFLNCDEGMELWRAIQVVKEKDGDSGFGSIYPAFADKNPLVPTLVVPPPGGRTTDARYKHSDGDNISVGSTLSGSSCYSIEDEMAKNNESFLRCWNVSYQVSRVISIYRKIPIVVQRYIYIEREKEIPIMIQSILLHELLYLLQCCQVWEKISGRVCIKSSL